MTDRQPPTLKAEFQSTIRTILVLIGSIWVIQVVNALSGGRLSAIGVLPRTVRGLVGIPLAPFIHHGFLHVMANTLPLAILGWLVVGHGLRRLVGVTAFVALAGGAGVWLIGRRAVHAGASGLVFGYFGYLVARGWYRRSLGALVTAFLVIFLYGGIIWGVLPRAGFISWEGHLCGLLAGVLAARFEGRDP